MRTHHPKILLFVSRSGYNKAYVGQKVVLYEGDFARIYCHKLEFLEYNNVASTCHEKTYRQSDRQFDGQLAWALRTGFTLARWLANPMHLCYANLGYALLYINIWQRTLLLSFLFSLRFSSIQENRENLGLFLLLSP